MSEFLDVARQVFMQERRPMRASDVVDYALRHALFSDQIAGKTPHQTLKSKLSVDIRRKGETSQFVRTGPGLFYLRDLIGLVGEVYHARPYKKPPSTEQVLVFPTTLLDDIGRFQGIEPSWRKRRKQILSSGHCRYMNRLSAELSNDYKQVLSYIMVTSNGRVLSFKRGSHNRTEAFLRGSQCIGFGGHVADRDLDLFSASDGDFGLARSAARELSEELRLARRDKERLTAGKLTPGGTLNDDSSEVGRRHFAFVFRYEVSRDPTWCKPERGEKSVTQLRWIGGGQNPVRIWDFEYWSQLCLRKYFARIVRAASAFRIRRTSPLRPPHILCVLGELGSGKTEATRYLKDHFGYKEVNSGHILARLLAIPPVPNTPRAEFQQRAWQFISSPDGPQQLAAAISEAAEHLHSDRVLVDGIRQRSTLAALRKNRSDQRIGCLYIHTLPDIAYDFYRARENPSISIFEFLALREACVEKEVPRMIADSDAVLYNWTGLSTYRLAIRKLLAAIG